MGLTLVSVVFVLLLVAYTVMFHIRSEKKIGQQGKLLKEAEAQVIQMEKMASLGILAAGIAHEINNPLSFLISNLQALNEYVQCLEHSSPEQENKKFSLDDLKAIVQESVDGAMHIKKIVSDLRTFSRRSETQKVLVDINQVLESVLSIVWNEIKYKIMVIKEYQLKSDFFGDPTQLSQVFLNIIINASQAIADKGKITLKTYEDAENIYVKITDTGCGIPKDVLAKIFDPFFSTKKSTGLGLSVCYNIIKSYNGTIKVESKEDYGSVFAIQLPKNK